jgi:hypothetical protein
MSTWTRSETKKRKHEGGGEERRIPFVLLSYNSISNGKPFLSKETKKETGKGEGRFKLGRAGYLSVFLSYGNPFVLRKTKKKGG